MTPCQAPCTGSTGLRTASPDDVGARLVSLAERFELVWATGWEERANEHLPYLLRLPFRDLPSLTFAGRAVFGSAHWKVDAIDEYAEDRPAAWIDDNLDEDCIAWAEGRAAPTLLVETKPGAGAHGRARRAAARLGGRAR